MPTLPDYPRVSHTERISRPLIMCHRISWIKHIKAHKMHLSDIFWPISEILGKTFLIFDEFVRFNLKIFTLNNAF